jgi:hypothetical protein
MNLGRFAYRVYTRMVRIVKCSCVQFLWAGFEDPNELARLEFGAARGSSEGNHIADIRHAGDEHEHPLETESETGVGRGSVASKI